MSVVSSTPSVCEHMEARLTAVTPGSCHTRLTLALSRAVTSSTERTCNPQGGEKEKRKKILVRFLKKRPSPHGSSVPTKLFSAFNEESASLDTLLRSPRHWMLYSGGDILTAEDDCVTGRRDWLTKTVLFTYSFWLNIKEHMVPIFLFLSSSF